MLSGSKLVGDQLRTS